MRNFLGLKRKNQEDPFFQNNLLVVVDSALEQGIVVTKEIASNNYVPNIMEKVHRESCEPSAKKVHCTLDLLSLVSEVKAEAFLGEEVVFKRTVAVSVVPLVFALTFLSSVEVNYFKNSII